MQTLWMQIKNVLWNVFNRGGPLMIHMNRPVVGVLGTTVVQSPTLGAGGAARLSARKGT